MSEDIFYGNLLGLLKRGRWTLSLEEASALLSIVKETEQRYAKSKITLPPPHDPSPITPRPIKKSSKRGEVSQ